MELFAGATFKRLALGSAVLGLVWTLATTPALAAPTKPSALARCKRAVVTSVRRVGLGLGVLVAVHGATLGTAKVLNLVRPPSEETTVYVAAGDFPILEGRVKIGLHEPLTGALTALATYPPVALEQALRGKRTALVVSPTRSEVLASIGDPSVENVVFVGHGSQQQFGTADGSVSARDIAQLPGFQRKSGELRQYTCGSDFGGLKLSEALLLDPSRGFSFDDTVFLGENWARTWTDTIMARPRQHQTPVVFR
jgi:hypothetical protein